MKTEVYQLVSQRRSNQAWVASRLALFVVGSIGMIFSLIILATWEDPDILRKVELACIIILSLTTMIGSGLSAIKKLENAINTIATLEENQSILVEVFDLDRKNSTRRWTDPL